MSKAAAQVSPSKPALEGTLTTWAGLGAPGRLACGGGNPIAGPASAALGAQ